MYRCVVSPYCSVYDGAEGNLKVNNGAETGASTRVASHWSHEHFRHNALLLESLNKFCNRPS